MKSKYPLTILITGLAIISFMSASVFPQVSEQQEKKPELGITLMGGFYWPWMDWTVDGSFKVEGSPSKTFYNEWLKGPNVKKNLGGAGILLRKPTYALRFTLQYGKTTDMEYYTYRYQDQKGVDTTYSFKEDSRPHVNFSMLHFSFSAMQYLSLYQKKINGYLGGGFGFSILKYYDYLDKSYDTDSDWGLHMYPLAGLEYKITPNAGIFTEMQYIISSTFKRDFTETIETKTFEGNYHLNTNGINLQAGIYYLIK